MLSEINQLQKDKQQYDSTYEVPKVAKLESRMVVTRGDRVQWVVSVWQDGKVLEIYCRMI